MDGGGATRSRLLALQARTRLAEQGRDLLQRKRMQLLGALRELSDAVLSGGEALEREAADARASLALAEALDGPEALRSAALAARSEVPLEARTSVILGVRLPDVRHGAIGRACTDRGYSLAGSSPRIDAAAQRYERLLELTLEAASQEIRLRRLASEVRKVTRRVNALENVVIPEHVAAGRAIEAVLDERERQDRFRLQRMKRRRERRGAAG